MTTKTIGTCAGCLRPIAMTAKGRIVRHGFKAHGIRHNEHGGFHTGSCQGTGRAPIGTNAGNEYALRLASDADGYRRSLEDAPALTIEDATADAIREASTSALRRIKHPTNEDRAKYATAASFRGTSWSGWFAPSALADRQRRLTNRRLETIETLRANAKAYREAVAANPAP